MEHYRIERGAYALFVESTPILVTAEVAVLVDLRLGTVVTHGAPACVRAEYAEMRAAAQGADLARWARDWVVVCGRPPVALLNAALRGGPAVWALVRSCREDEEARAWHVAQATIRRLSGRTLSPPED